MPVWEMLPHARLPLYSFYLVQQHAAVSCRVLHWKGLDYLPARGALCTAAWGCL